ncbi:hypothetical protein ACFVZ3_04380 [Kitasatospora purpeofusca]|uniref:hypothetical protein n=1 Tax=Kitasatospora purpeofusca TaxID=67352 RepID=UPI0036904E21
MNGATPVRSVTAGREPAAARSGRRQRGQFPGEGAGRRSPARGGFGAGTARLAAAHARISGGRTHRYSFAYRSTALGGRLDAAHTVGLPFVFDNAHRPWLHADTRLLGPDPVPTGLAARVHGAWTAFARTGDPGWARYDPRHPAAEPLGGGAVFR